MNRDCPDNQSAMSPGAITKHFINDPEKLVLSALRSIPLLNPTVGVDDHNKVVYRRHYDPESPKKVSIVSGGGAGHEPSFVSFVGVGMLDAAVSGTIFASPSPAQIYAALKGLDQRARMRNSGAEGHSILMILMNYTGDVMNFGLAAEKANAAGVKVDMVIVNDDVGVGREKGGKVGRRGIAGTVLIHKIAGDMAEKGYRHTEIKQIAELAASNLVSVGASLSHVHVPGHDESHDTLQSNEIEIGMGIHNEPGFRRLPMPDLPELVKLLLGQLLNEEDPDRAYLGKIYKDDEFVLMINNLGGVSPLELGGITTEVVEQLGANYCIKPKRVYSGTFMTSLNGNGVSISLLRIADTRLLEFLDGETQTLGSPSAMHFHNWYQVDAAPEFDDKSKENTVVEYNKSGLTMDVDLFVDIVSAALKGLIAAEKEITKYDSLVGDGDCGTGLRRGAEAVLKLIQSDTLENDAAVVMQKIAEAVERSMDGTSGALYCIFFNAFSLALRNRSQSGARPITSRDWYMAALSAQQSLSKYTPARPGDRTLMDALYPFLQTLNDANGDLHAAVEAARQGAESTRGMKATLGRTVYVGSVGDIPDPGAIGVSKFVEGLGNGLRKSTLAN
ncbi:Dak1 domain-containing protein [Kalaharituber pfeilii]|nr:Dak1 domain-containing protein [Kalaharituber pfeilii]